VAWLQTAVTSGHRRLLRRLTRVEGRVIRVCNLSYESKLEGKLQLLRAMCSWSPRGRVAGVAQRSSQLTQASRRA
jgi:hypothetical protein